jgi:hypothetical protein
MISIGVLVACMMFLPCMMFSHVDGRDRTLSLSVLSVSLRSASALSPGHSLGCLQLTAGCKASAHARTRECCVQAVCARAVHAALMMMAVWIDVGRQASLFSPRFHFGLVGWYMRALHRLAVLLEWQCCWTLFVEPQTFHTIPYASVHLSGLHKAL